MARQDSFFYGEAFGLPAKVHRVPFGQESRSKELIGLTEGQLQLVMALVAAEFTQMGPVTADEIDGIVETCPQSHMRAIVKAGWAEEVGFVKRSTEKLYVPTRKAWRELLPEGWSLLKEVA